MTQDGRINAGFSPGRNFWLEIELDQRFPRTGSNFDSGSYWLRLIRRTQIWGNHSKTYAYGSALSKLALAIYRFTSTLPPDERYGLVSQLRRSAVSVASNIAEGYGRASKGEYLQFQGHARGSNSEIETQLIIARELEFGNAALCNEAEELCKDVGRLLCALMRSLRPPS